MKPFGQDPDRDNVIRLMCHEGVKTISISGSQYICDPPPVGSDEDWVLMCHPSRNVLPKMFAILRSRGFTGPEVNSYGESSSKFTAWRKITSESNLNFLVTKDEEWFTLHGWATSICKWLNLQHKPDRIAVFEAILYRKVTNIMKCPRIRFSYRNHRQQINERDVTVKSITYLDKPGYGYEPGWFLIGYDHDRAADRRFKFENIIASAPGGALTPVLFDFEVMAAMDADEVAAATGNLKK